MQVLWVPRLATVLSLTQSAPMKSIFEFSEYKVLDQNTLLNTGENENYNH